MITDADIERALALHEMHPMTRFLMHRSVDRLRFAEGGGIRDQLARCMPENRFWFFMGMTPSVFTRDELIAIIAYERERTGWVPKPGELF